MNEIFYKLFSGGNFSLPFLIKFTHPKLNAIRLVNNNESVQYKGEIYTECSFDYKEPDFTGASGSLRITGIGNDLINFIEHADDKYKLEVVGVLAEGGTIQEIKSYTHFFGTVTYTDNMTLDFQLGRDDRLEMIFPPYLYDTENNKGNA